MTPGQLRRWWPSYSRVGVFAIVGVLFIAGLLTPWLLVARAAPAAEVTLKLWPAGQGRIEVTQGGHDLVPNPCGFYNVLLNGHADPCLVTVAVGTPVTLTAVAEPNATVPVGQETDVPDFPVAQPAFVRWSRFDCGTAASCTFTPESDSDGDWITAVFTPLQLQVGVFGSSVDTGDITFRRSDGVVVQPPCQQDSGYGDRTCHAALPADIDVVIETSRTPTGWGPSGCEPEGGNTTSSRCLLGMSNLRTLAFVSFDPAQDPLGLPFQLKPRVKVKLGGSGHGHVTGTGIDCPSTCQLEVDYQARVKLQAEENAGSTFVRWVGVCSTNPTCVFNAGSATEVQARFDTTPPPTTTTSTTTRSTTTTATTTSTSTTTTTTTTTRPPKPPRLGSVSVRGHGNGRFVSFAVIVDRRARAVVSLLKQRKKVTSKGFVLAKGRNALRLHVPRGTKPGHYRLSATVVVGGKIHTLGASVAIHR